MNLDYADFNVMPPPIHLLMMFVRSSSAEMDNTESVDNRESVDKGNLWKIGNLASLGVLWL